MADRYGNYGNQDVEAWRRIPTNSEPKMEAEPPLWKRITTSIMSDPMPSPMPAGLVMKGPNAGANTAKVAMKIRDILPDTNKASTAEKAIAYVKAKYPRLSGLADIAPSAEIAPNRGYFQGAPTRAGRKISINPEAFDSDLSDMVNTGGHELTHAAQDTRMNPSPFEFDANGKMNDEAVAKAEIGADRGGDTAERTYNRFRGNMLYNRGVSWPGWVSPRSIK